MKTPNTQQIFHIQWLGRDERFHDTKVKASDGLAAIRKAKAKLPTGCHSFTARHASLATQQPKEGK